MDERLPLKEEAEQLLTWANDQNPGPWYQHSLVAARAAQTIAENCGMDTHKAYISGLLHDIGRYEGVSHMHHIYAGYKLLMDKGYETIAPICLTHSFPYQNIGAYSGNHDCTEEELSFISSFLSNTIYDDYDKLIQLCDSLGSAQGVCLIDIRMLDVVRRYGFNDFTINKWNSTFQLKDYFSELCRRNVYELFCDEIIRVSF